MNLPRPTTKRAILPSAGLAYSKATKHTYAETKPIFEAGSVVGYEHIYVCTETNRRRRWGLEGRPNQSNNRLEPDSESGDEHAHIEAQTLVDNPGADAAFEGVEAVSP